MILPRFFKCLFRVFDMQFVYHAHCYINIDTLKVEIIVEQIFAVGRSKNCEFYGVYFHNWIIYCTFHGIYFRDEQIWKVTGWRKVVFFI